jgi:hypothetical protein
LISDKGEKLPFWVQKQLARAHYYNADCDSMYGQQFESVDWKMVHGALHQVPRSIGHPPHSSASPVELRLRVGPRALSGKKKNLGNRG